MTQDPAIQGSPSVHASAVLVGASAVLIRGPSGAGKSHLAFDLILAGRAGLLPETRLIGDDRVYLDAQDGHLVVRPVPALLGLIEIRGLGLRHCPHATGGPVGLVVDLAAADAARLPVAEALRIELGGIALPRVPIGTGFAALPVVLAALTTAAAPGQRQPQADCPQEICNHIRPTLATL